MRLSWCVSPHVCHFNFFSEMKRLIVFLHQNVLVIAVFSLCAKKFTGIVRSSGSFEIQTRIRYKLYKVFEVRRKKKPNWSVIWIQRGSKYWFSCYCCTDWLILLKNTTSGERNVGLVINLQCVITITSITPIWRNSIRSPV